MDERCQTLIGGVVYAFSLCLSTTHRYEIASFYVKHGSLSFSLFTMLHG